MLDDITEIAVPHLLRRIGVEIDALGKLLQSNEEAVLTLLSAPDARALPALQEIDRAIQIAGDLARLCQAAADRVPAANLPVASLAPCLTLLAMRRAVLGLDNPSADLACDQGAVDVF